MHRPFGVIVKRPCVQAMHIPCTITSWMISSVVYCTRHHPYNTLVYPYALRNYDKKIYMYTFKF